MSQFLSISLTTHDRNNRLLSADSLKVQKGQKELVTHTDTMQAVSGRNKQHSQTYTEETAQSIRGLFLLICESDISSIFP